MQKYRDSKQSKEKGLCMIGKEKCIKEKVSLRDFVKNNKLAWHILVLGLVMAYGIKIFNVSLSHDTEAIIAVPNALYNSWYTLGRFGLILLKKLLGTYIFNPYLASIMMVVMMVINGIAWMYFFSYIQGCGKTQKTGLNCVFPLLFFTSLIYAEQSGFILQSYEVGIALSLLVFALFICFKGILEQKRWWYYIPAVVCCAIAFATYQTFVLLFAAAAAASFLLLYDSCDKAQNSMTVKQCWIVIVKLISIFLLSYIIYYVLNKIVLSILEIEISSYITEQVLWGNISDQQCINNIILHVLNVIKGNGLFYPITYTVSCIAMIGYVVFRFKKNVIHNFMYILALVFCMLSPFLMTIYMGGVPNERTQLLLPFITAFFLWYILIMLSENINKKRIIIYLFMLGFTCIAILEQVQTTSQLYYTQYVQYEEDVRLAEKISDRIEKLGYGEMPKEPVVFIGSREPQMNAACIDNSKLSLIGKSFFQISFGTAHGTWVMNHFMSTIGYSYVYPITEQISIAEQAAVDMPVWPDEGSVIEKNGCIIVKFK